MYLVKRKEILHGLLEYVEANDVVVSTFARTMLLDYKRLSPVDILIVQIHWGIDTDKRREEEEKEKEEATRRSLKVWTHSMLCAYRLCFINLILNFCYKLDRYHSKMSHSLLQFSACYQPFDS